MNKVRDRDQETCPESIKENKNGYKIKIICRN
jgi:hypothetical protein